MGVIDVYLSASIKVTRRAKDGKDGVGITSADVVFAQSKSNTNPPADTDVWKTKVDELSLVDGNLWSGTKIIYSNKKIAITGKYCIGSTRDYTDIEELYYLSDSGDKIPTNVTFQPSFKPEKGKYLWTCIRYRFKAQSGSAENTNWVYSTPTCAGYFGDDGVSVQSSDVVFAISESKTTAPTTGWITNFGGLTLAEGKYVWTCTKTTLTDGDSYYTGAYCLGECYDFAQVDELYALGSSATKSPDIDSSLGVNIWQSSYTPKKGMYLWTCVRVIYNSNTPPYYLNKKCVSYFPADGTNGTKFTPKGTAYGHYTASSKMPKPSDDVLGLFYLVDKVDTLLTPINKPCVVWWRSLSAGSYILSYDVAEEGDAYNVGGTLWVHNGTVWKDFGSIQGPKGDDGEDALNIELSTDKILFSWDSKNKIYDVATKDITLIVKQGNNIINIDDYTINFQAVENFELGSNNKNIRTDGAADGYTYNISVYSAGIAMKEYTFNASVNDKKQTVNYPASSCSVKMLITYNGITYTKIIAIEVSFVQMYGDTAWNTEQLSSTYGKLTAGYNGTLAQMESKITQNANNIALKVSQEYYDENNKKVDERFSIIEQSVDNIKLEVSATSNGLKNTGINITDGTIKMTAANFTLVNNNGAPTLGVDAFGNCSLKGTINATGGNFGSLQMTSFTDATGFEFYGMSAHTDGTSIIAASTYRLDYQGLYVGSGLRNNGGSVHIGNRGGITDGDFSWDEGVVNVEADNSGASNADISGIGVNVVGNPSHSAIGMKVSATGGKNNYAIYAENGDFRAENGAFIGVHRGNMTKIDSDYTLKKTDSTIVCNNTTKDISIYLPSDAVVGTYYRIIKKGKTVTLRSSNKNIGVVNNIDLKSSVSSGTAREWINCLWDGDCWNVEMSRS
nr:MAG TPA: hypothetical protein [Caudoviricetes sp.]